MYNNNIVMPGEDAGESFPNTTGEVEQSYRAAEWEAAMEDADGFQGEWGYGEPQTFDSVKSSDPATVPEKFNQDTSPDQGLSSASRITSYGFDTVCRVYDLNTVLTKIYNTDVTSGDATFNPLGKIYEEIEPRPEARAYLFQEIQKDLVANNKQNSDPDLNTERSPLGMTPYGEMYDKRIIQGGQEQTSLDAILALKKLLDALATEPRFERLRQRAASENKSIIDLLVGDTINPTITTFLNGVGGELSTGSVEAVLDEIDSAETERSNSDHLDEDTTLHDKNMLELDELAVPSSESDITDTIIEKFNQSMAAPDDPKAHPWPKDDLLSDEDFQNILNDELSHPRQTSEFDSVEIVERLKDEVPLDFEEIAKLTKSRKSGDFPVDQAA